MFNFIRNNQTVFQIGHFAFLPAVNSLITVLDTGHSNRYVGESQSFNLQFPSDMCLKKEMATHSSFFCLENPRDGGVWWAATYGVSQSQTRLKRLSGSSSSDVWCGAYFHIFTCYLNLFLFFFSEVSEQIFSSFLKSFFSFSYWRILSSFYILANSLLHMSFANVFSQFICLVCHFLNNIFHWEEVFNFNEIQLIKYFFHRSCF